jgi:outer membrane lipoprotein SlyB
MDILMGIGGAVVGGFVTGFADYGGYRGTIITTVGATTCALLFTAVAAYVNGRRFLHASSRHPDRRAGQDLTLPDRPQPNFTLRRGLV